MAIPNERPVVAVPQTAAGQALGMVLGNGWMSRALQASVLAGTLYQSGRGIYDRWQESRTYTIRISSYDDIYADVHRWLLDQMPERAQRSVIASTTRSGGSNTIAPSDSSRTSKRVALKYRYDGAAAVKLTVQGHPITVTLDREARDGFEKYLPPEDKIVFSVSSEAGSRAVKEILQSIADRRAVDDAARFYVATAWGSWNRAPSLTPRDPATVVLARGQMERLIADLGLFLANEECYARLGIPWHRGYLLEGPPGSGKSSVARALAYAHNLDIYYLLLSEVTSATSLSQLISGIPDRSLLLMEDVDISRAATLREDGQDRLSMDGLLNALDGAITPHGLVTVLSTNNAANLDPALKRPGRCDRTEHIGYLTDEQVARLIEVMTGSPCLTPSLGNHEMVAGDLIEIVKANINDMQRARAEIIEFLRERVAA